MSEVKHTPGPWSVRKERFIGPSINYTVSGVYNVPGGEVETKANARLIAAAPEMLEALKEAVAAYKTYDRFKVDVDAMRTIEAVIAKAEDTRHDLPS